MRITNSMMITQLMRNLNSNLKRMETYQYQLATGRRIIRPSQDPVGITRSLQARTELSKLDDYKQNIADAEAWLTQTETALMDMNSILTRAYELAVDAANGSKTPEDRQAVAKEIEQLKAQLLEAANTSYAGRYVFGGYNTTEKPFKIEKDPNDGFEYLWYNGVKIYNVTQNQTISGLDDNILDDNKIEYEVAPGTTMIVSLSGKEAMVIEGESNLYAILDKLSVALNSDDETAQEDINESIGELQNGQQEVLSMLAEVGGRTNRLELMENRYGKDEINYKAIKSEVEDVDHEQVIMEFMMAQMVYRSSLAVGARIIQPTLVDFLQ
jgi:flagellar hook-associated protein 3